MIKELRVDDRLIHGQIALTWPKALQIKHIIVANDKASNNRTQQMSLKMAVSDDVKVLIRSIEDTIQLFNNPKAKDIDMMIIVNSIVDAEKLAIRLPDMVHRVNVANVGRFDGVDKNKKVSLGSAILLNNNEIKASEKIIELGINIVHQIIPDDVPKDYKKLFEASVKKV